MDKKTVKHIADVEVHKHEKKMHMAKLVNLPKAVLLVYQVNL